MGFRSQSTEKCLRTCVCELGEEGEGCLPGVGILDYSIPTSKLYFPVGVLGNSKLILKFL